MNPNTSSNTPHSPHDANLEANQRLARFRVVLSHTSHPGNIGSAARAMKTMGLTRLYLVNPKEFPSEVAVSLASNAHDLLDNAVVVGSMAEALAGTTLQVAMTARRRELAQPLQTPRQLVPELIAEAQHGGEIALVFGTEMSGLTIDEVQLCNRRVTIPTNPDYSSLNLAQAVQVLCYELRASLLDDVSYLEEQRTLASHEYIELFYRHLEETLTTIGFLRPKAPKRLMPRLRRMYQRIGLEQEEVDILRGILRATLEFDRKQSDKDNQ
ncbi:RNA methyltransferase [Jeongeupia chitinilytica]|uniref:tRNA (cytidine/uridine-2'-O-)-methyltransferase TrmJ n=1 Tax=Jeongeupia chitinilytica TaxID=1041641 RepID=A0ABQ3H4E5_9NEIS|nr:RNA methyltransferase [Jeongeupia chitinilytica]GHD70038.1 tRNA (cytidine/uridine-2'-O-)-methyltransferase TrmJ [Jeongeupia chitinilytica]